MPDTTATCQTVASKYDTLIDMVSHELKSPLTTIKIFAEVLQKAPSAASASADVKYLAKIDSKVDQLTALINDYSDLVKIRSNNLDLHDEVNDYTQLLSASLINLHRQYPFNYKTTNQVDVSVKVDPSRFQQAVSKLIFHLLQKLSPQQDNILIISGFVDGQIVTNILNPLRQLPVKDYRLLTPGQPVKFYDDIEVTLADSVIKHYGGLTQLYLHPDYGYIFSLTLPPTK